MRISKRRDDAVEALEAAAPPGGRVVKVGEAYALWLPDGWTVGEEEGSHRFVWYREDDSQGGLRITTLELRKQIDMLEMARRVYEDMKESVKDDGEIGEFIVEEVADRTVANWRIASPEADVESVTVTHYWEVIRKLKALMISYSYDEAREGSKELQDELAEAKRIVHNSIPL